ncbi:thymus-specific serine protease-like [Drosophila sulfurigaster albostrigata]|uniref:thymus-specific serine protease-like n=1 Tax=Drosophila sulfurigaster albostrigata TaxID=89887 RepID=UPI002D21B2FA|nr:thymus-specific serine protease-like [Drosophila sulfurigaster albostrigata]
MLKALKDFKELSVLLLLHFLFATFIAQSDCLGIRFARRYDSFTGGARKVSGFRRSLDSKDLWFKQRLDNFAPEDTRTWLQRYYVNDQYYRNDSQAPVFLMIGGEGEASKKRMHKGAWIHYAKHFGALCIQLEHRYYGKSHPTSNLSTRNLAYLSSEQALADLSNFVIAMKGKYKLADTQKWIAFGGSYAGSLAAWAREKYPNLIYGAISSSAPLMAQVDFQQFYMLVKDSLGSYNPQCVKAVSDSFIKLRNQLRDQSKLRKLDAQFKTCTPLKDSIQNPLDIANFFYKLADHFASVVQYNPILIPIANICDFMVDDSIDTLVTRLGAINNFLLKKSNKTCLDYKYDKMISDTKNVSWDSENAIEGTRQWHYQTCTEFGFYQTSANKLDLFSVRFDVDFFIRQCMDVFSNRMDSNYLDQVVGRTNKYYGALKPETTQVLYVHGSIDPWRALGLYVSANPLTPTIYIEDTSHCADMYEPSRRDPPQLKEARKRILNYLTTLLKGQAKRSLQSKTKSYFLNF